MKGAFDKVWHKGLLYKLSKLNIPNRLFRWIHDYLHERTFQVRIGSEHSTIKNIGCGVPQGAILSPHLFNIMMADMPTDNEIKIYNYADDITLACIGDNIRNLKQKMQTYLNKLVTWLENDGFIVETTKCEMQIYTGKKKTSDCLLKVKNFWLPKVKKKVLLGVTFDAPKLTFTEHIQELTINIKKRLDIMKVMSSTVWGASQNVLRLFYIAYIRSKIDYGTIIFCSAPESALRKLDILQNRALRMILGARNTSPITSMEVLANIEPLAIHRTFLKAKQYLKLLERPETDETSHILRVDSHCNQIETRTHKTFMQDIKSTLQSLSLTSWQRSPTQLYSTIPPWHQAHITFTSMSPHISISYTEDYREMIYTRYQGYKRIFTDGSKENLIPSTSCAYFVEYKNLVEVYKLDPDHSIMAAELFALYQSILYIYNERDNLNNRYVILTDSMASLLILEGSSRSYIYLVNNIKQLLHELKNKCMIVLQWIKAHAGITGNEIADRAAKLGHSHTTIVPLQLSNEELLTKIKSGKTKLWNETWRNKVENSNVGAHTAMLFPNIESIYNFPIRNRRLEIVLNRFKIGHVGLNQYLNRFNMAQTPLCEQCQLPESIEHYLFYCPKYENCRSDLKRKLNSLGFERVNIITLLGNCNISKDKMRNIQNCVTQYLLNTGKIDVL